MNKTNGYYSANTIKNILDDLINKNIIDIKYLKINIRGLMDKVYLYKNFDWSDKVLSKKIISDGIEFYSDVNIEWENKYLNRVKFHDFEEFDAYNTFNSGLIMGGLRPNPETGEGGLGVQWAGFSLNIDYTSELEKKLLIYSKEFISKYDIRVGSIDLNSIQEEKIGLNYNGIIQDGFLLFRDIKYCVSLCPELVKEIGIENLLKSPAYKVEELPNGAVFIQSTESIMDYVNLETREKKLQELKELNDYLYSINPSDEIQDSIQEKWNQELYDKHITIDDLINS